MSNNFVPDDKNERRRWLDNFDDKLQAETEDIGVDAAQKSEFHDLRMANDSADDDKGVKLIAYEGAVTASNDADGAATGYARTLVGIVQASPNTTDEMRREMELTIAKTTRTPVGVPQTTPICTLDVSVTREHALNFRDSATPNSKAKPAGVQSAQISMVVLESSAPAPTSQNDFRFLANDSKTPYKHDFPMEDVGKTAYYLLCWVNTKGQLGPLSAIYSATIAG